MSLAHRASELALAISRAREEPDLTRLKRLIYCAASVAMLQAPRQHAISFKLGGTCLHSVLTPLRAL